MQSERLAFRDMADSDVSQAFPLAQAAGVAVALNEWLTFARDLLRTKNGGRRGMRGLVNSKGTIVGLLVYAFDGDPLHGMVLEITHIIALNRLTAEALLEEGLRIAQEKHCTLIRTDVSVGDLWLGSFLRGRGFTLERHRLTCALPAHPS